MFLGYEPAWQDIFGTESGDLREMLRVQIDQCKGVVQLVGSCYGAEPPTIDSEFGRVSYTQYEALYARKRGKKVWYLFIDENFPIDAHEPEPEELRNLQAAYRNRLQADTHIFHPLTNREGLEAGVLKLRDDLTRLRRGVKQWALAVAVLLVISVGLGLFILRGQRRTTNEVVAAKQEMIAMTSELAKLRQGIADYPKVEAQVRSSRTSEDQSSVQEAVYADLGKQLGVDPKVLREKLPQLAAQLKSKTDAPSYERASAAYVSGDQAAAERLSLQAAADSQKPGSTPSSETIKALKLAGLAAQKNYDYWTAMEHFRNAEKQIDRQRAPEEWSDIQATIADLLSEQGLTSEAESALRTLIDFRNQTFGPENPGTLQSRNRLAFVLNSQGRYKEAETEFRGNVELGQKVLGPEHPDTLSSRAGLAAVLNKEGQFWDSELEYRQILKVREKVQGPTHPSTLRTRIGLADVLVEQARYEEAEPVYRETIKLNETTLGPEHQTTLRGSMALANLLFYEAKYDEAAALYREITKVSERTVREDHPQTLQARAGLAEVLLQQGKYDEAETEGRLVAALQEKVIGPKHPNTLKTRYNLARTLARKGNYDGAEPEFREVLALDESVLGPEHPDTLRTCLGFADCLAREEKTEEARRFAARALEGMQKVFRPGHPTTREAQKLKDDLEAKPASGPPAQAGG
jgi:tetratricopeptide (TPR) repeat protein